MMKFCVKIAFCLLTASLCCCGVTTAAPSLKAQSAILLDARTGQVLWEKQMHKRSAPASTTKILTAIIAIEAGQLDAEVKVSPRAAATRGSSMYLYPGQVLTLKELLDGLMLRSGNDAAVAIAEYIAGSTEEFAGLMNQKALTIGAKDSHFVNPHGLSTPGHYSSAHDLALIARYALANPVFAHIVRTKETNIDWLDRRGKEQERAIRNTNKLLWMFTDADGVKTGTTNEAGPCLVASATRASHRLISVVLHDHERWSDTMKLLQYGFQAFDLLDYASEGQVLATLPIENGVEQAVSIRVAAPAALVVRSEDFSATSVEVDLPEIIRAPVLEGQKIGEITFFTKDKAVKAVDLVADKTVEERSMSRVFLVQLTQLFKLLSGWGIL